MNSMRLILPVASVALGFVFTGCASKKVLFFGTGTSLGLNVSGTTQVPDKVAFAYERSEIAFVPRNPGGPAHSVVGTLDADINFWGKKSIHQVFTIGQAAENYADRMAGKEIRENYADTSSTDAAKNRESLVFVTHTTTGLKLAAGEGAVAPNFLLGFRRGEAALVPVKDKEKARSVFGELSYSTNAATLTPAAQGVVVPGTALGGVRIKQVFATGRAAEVFASSREGVAKITAAIGANIPAEDPDVLNFLMPSANAYNKAKTEGDTEAIKAFDVAARVAGAQFTTAEDFFTAGNKTMRQAKDFEAAAKANARSNSYY